MSEKPAIIQNISNAGIRTDMLDTFTNTVGLSVLWEKSYLCPCRDKATKQPSQACPRCFGRGIGYLPPVSTKVIIQSQEKGVFNADLGLIDSGTAIGTPQDRTIRMSFRDRITLNDVEARVSQSFIFDVTDKRIKNGFYMVYDVHQIEFVTSMAGDLYENEDYTVDLKKNLFFPKPHLKGKMISINILTTLRYMIADLLKEHRYAPDQSGKQVKIQQKLLLKREDLFISKEAFDLGVDNAEVGEIIDPKRKPSTDGLNGFFRGGS